MALGYNPAVTAICKAPLLTGSSEASGVEFGTKTESRADFPATGASRRLISLDRPAPDSRRPTGQTQA